MKADADITHIDLSKVYYDYVDHSHDDVDPITVDKLLNQLDDVYNTSAYKRNILIDKLMETVSRVHIDPMDDDVDDVSKKVMIIDQANKILAEQEKAFSNRINMRLKQKEADSNIASGQLAAEILKKISLTNIPNLVDPNDVPTLEDQLKNLDTQEPDILDTELKTDAKDIPMLKEKEQEDTTE